MLFTKNGLLGIPRQGSPFGTKVIAFIQKEVMSPPLPSLTLEVHLPAHRGDEGEDAELSPAIALIEDEIGVLPIEDIVDPDGELMAQSLGHYQQGQQPLLPLHTPHPALAPRGSTYHPEGRSLAPS